MATDKIVRALLVSSACLAAAPAGAQNIAEGQAIAERLCSRCHAVALDQKSKHALAPPFPVIAQRYSVWGLQEALAEGIIVGHADMPKFVFSPSQIDDLLGFMDTFTRNQGKAK